MNTRIQELAEQAESYAYSAVVGGSECQEAFIKKFAELIVGECVAIVEEDGSAVLPLIILKHFGVEE